MVTQKKRFPLLRSILIPVLFLSACTATATPSPTAAPPTAPPVAAATATTSAPAQPAATETVAAPTEPAAPAPPIATAASRPDLKGELVINTWRDIGADPKHPSYSLHLLIQEWAKNHPDVTVSYQPMLGTVIELFGYITTNLRSGTLGDVVMQYFPSPAQLDPDLQYDFSADLTKPNPYSTNPTWRDDFPLDGAAFRNVTVDSKVLMVGTTFVGDLGDTAVLYNQDLLDQAGVTQLPKTWEELYDAMAKLKAAGIDPVYMPTAGNEAYIFSWYVSILSDEFLGDIVKACDGQVGEQQDGLISQKEATWCIKKGKWNAQDPGVRALFEEMKKWSEYWHEGYLAPPAPGDLFVQGKVAFRPIVRINMSFVEGDPSITFKWGSFYFPPVLPGTTPHRVGNAGAGQGSQFLFIPKTTVDNGKLDLALDLLQYITSPKSLEYWCTLQQVPCYEPGTSIEEIFPDDPVRRERYRGFVEPPALNNRASFLDVNNAFGQANSVREIQIFQDYLGGTTDLDQALDAYQKMLDELADNVILQHPEWGADQW